MNQESWTFLHAKKGWMKPVFEATCLFFVFLSFLQTTKLAISSFSLTLYLFLFLSTVTVTSSVEWFYPHSWHFLSGSLRLCHVDVNLLVKGKGERVGEGKGFYSCAASQSGGQLLPLDQQQGLKGCQKNCANTPTRMHTHSGICTHKRDKMENTVADTAETHTDNIMHKHKDTAVETHLLFIHTFFSYILLYFSLSYKQCSLFTAQSQLQITSANHEVMCARTTANQN